MRPISLGYPFSDADFPEWVKRSLTEIEQASHDDIATVSDAFTITGTYTSTREIDASAATLAELRAFVATFVSDFKRRGSKRS